MRDEVAATARMLAAAGLVEAFGHTSARTGDGFAITSTRPMRAATADDVLLVGADGPISGPIAEAPLELAMHAAVYASRADVGAICRGHPPSVVVWGAGTGELPMLHGLGGMSGRTVRVHDDIELIKTADAAAAVAATLGSDHSVILRANGCLSVGTDLLEAATRLWFLEERARVVLAARGVGAVPADPAAWERRLGDSPAELARAKQWFRAEFGGGG